LLSRRSFCGTLAGVLVAPGIAIGQASRIRRIGVLEPGAPASPERLRMLAEPLRELGWVEGENLHVEYRYDNGRPEQLQLLAEELVRAKVEIIVTAGTPATLAAMHATDTIPIVFGYSGDPLLGGLVATLARPGGNVTGYSAAQPEVRAKSLSVLKELLPSARRIGVLWGADQPRIFRAQFEHTCQSLGLEPIIIETNDNEAGDADRLIAQLMRQRAEALFMESGIDWDWDKLAEAFEIATKYRLPTMGEENETVIRCGALIAYTTTLAEAVRRRAEYIDRILRGAKPADLPVQQPTKFELAINLKTAKALGLTIPQSLLARADKVIQ
jgi:putative ABC transport system substrate-binding protein